MTVKELKEAIANLPDEGEVFIQRIEDKYFEGKGAWSVIKQKGEEYWRGVRHNVESDTYREEYPFSSWPKYSLEELTDLEEQYISTWCCINYDKVNLYITSHY